MTSTWARTYREQERDDQLPREYGRPCTCTQARQGETVEHLTACLLESIANFSGYTENANVSLTVERSRQCKEGRVLFCEYAQHKLHLLSAFVLKQRRRFY